MFKGFERYFTSSGLLKVLRKGEVWLVVLGDCIREGIL